TMGGLESDGYIGYIVGQPRGSCQVLTYNNLRQIQYPKMPARAAEDTDFTALRSLLSADEIITPESPEYSESSKTWASQKQCHPRLVVRPTSVESLSKTIAHLYSTKLDFAIYGHGFMSVSAKDVLVNISCFDEFHLDSS